MKLQHKHIVLGVTGGVAAYKAAELVRLLRREGATVQVVMTESATRFVTPMTFQALSGRPVFTDQWDDRSANHMLHIDLSREADAIVVAPATAGFIAKLAHGMADDLLSALVLARPNARQVDATQACPVWLAPAMNHYMWLNPATQRNVETIMTDGLFLLGPDSGDQACGETGPGRMLAPEAIVTALIAAQGASPLRGRKVLVTAGPTFEAIDPVRGLSNISSGKMGFAVAAAAAEAGAEVILVAGPVSLPTPSGVQRIDVISAAQMYAAVMARAAAQDIFIGVAAVADYRPKQVADRKIKKTAHHVPPMIELELNPDILAAVAALPNPPFCVGFAAESEDLATYATQKRQTKKVPLIVGNLVQDSLGGDDAALVLFDAHGQTPLPRAPKPVLARALLAHIEKLLM